jgi:adenylate cyclase
VNERGQLDPDVDETELVALDLYDPDAPDAAERLTMLRLAIESGATVGEMQEAIDEQRLHALAAERVIAGGTERLTLDEAIARAGIEPALGLRVWRAYGFVVPEPDALVCSERDVELFATFELASATFGEEPALALMRTAGASMARLADAAVSGARALLEAPIRSEGGTSADIARTFLDVAQNVVPPLHPMIETVHRHHLVATGRRYSAWGTAPTPESTSDAVVGFADLVGFTSLSQNLSSTELQQLVDAFEGRALVATSRPAARLVKTIGDEAMFVAGSAADAVDIAHELLADEEVPPLRVGLAAGEITTREGDVYGATVNRAARLVGIAQPLEILCDAEAARRLERDGGAAVPVGTRTLAGFDEPVEVFEVSP